MTTKQEGRVALYDDAEETSNPHEITGLPTMPFSNRILGLDEETAAEYIKETATQRDLTQLQEHFKLLQEKLDQLGTTMNTPANTKELLHLTDKLQKLA